MAEYLLNNLTKIRFGRNASNAMFYFKQMQLAKDTSSE